MRFSSCFTFCLFVLSAFSIQLDFIVNGNFSYNQCPETYCSWNAKTYIQTDVYGWLPDPQIAIGTGNIFNPILSNQKALTLGHNIKSCVKQVFDTLNFGSYTLNLQYTSYQDQQKSQNSQFIVYFNQKQVKNITAFSERLQTQSINVKLDSFSKNVELKFCGVKQSENGGFGPIITKVELWGETKSYLRKEYPILEKYHLLSPRERSSRLLQTTGTTVNTISNPPVKILTEFDASLPKVTSWVQKSGHNLNSNAQINQPWKSNSFCSKSSNSMPSWNEKPSSIKINEALKIKDGWISNSKCKSQSEESSNPLWIQKQSSLNTNQPIDSKNSWKSSQNCRDDQQQKNSLWKQKPSNLNENQPVNSENAWKSNQNCKDSVESSTNLLWIEKPSTIDEDQTHNSENSWKSNQNCKDKPKGSTNMQWQQKKNLFDKDQPIDSHNAWKQNSKCIRQPENLPKPVTIIDSKIPTLEELMTPQSQQQNSINTVTNPKVNSQSEGNAYLQTVPQHVPRAEPTQTSSNPQVHLTNSDVKHPETVVSNSHPQSQNIPQSKPTDSFPSTQKDLITSLNLLPNTQNTQDQVISKDPSSQQTQKIPPIHTQTEVKTPIIPQKLSQSPEALIKSVPQAPAVESHIIEQLIEKPVLKSETGQNLIINGDFQKYKCANTPCLINQMIPGSSLPSWIAEPFIEIGKSNQYNPSLKASSDDVAGHLGFSTKNTCIKQSLKSLTTNYYKLSFDYAPVVPHVSDFVSEAFFIVKFNGKNVKNVLCLDKVSHRQSMVVRGIKGENIIEFCAFGSLNENPHGAIVDNVSLIAMQNPESMKTDFILNGDFENNDCHSKSCLWGQKDFNTRYLPGWLPEPQIEIGKGNVYNVHAGTSTVAELSPNSNSCIKQIINNCVKGSFKLVFSWAARQSEVLHDSVFQVKLNSKLVQSFIPNDYTMHRQTLVLNLNEGKNELKFCSFGTNNNKGAIIDDVSMFLIDSCQSM